MPKRAQGISAAKVQKAGPGRYGDGAGLYLLVRGPELKFWLFRWVRGGRMREMGLGPAVGRTAVSLADARKRARELHDMVREGRDPLDERKARRAALLAETAKAATFNECAAAYIEAHHSGWKNAKHAAQWPTTLRAYAGPVIGALPVQAIDTALVLKVLEPIWKTKPETAGRLRGRIEAVLNWAKTRGYRDGENPARWKGHLNNLLPSRSKVRPIEHHPALPYDEIGAFTAKLHKEDGVAARCLEFVILTCARTGEAIGAKWAEIDFDKKVWIIPGERMKAGREHRVPLADRAVAILKALPREKNSDFVFTGRKPGTSLSNMALLETLRRMKRGDLTTHGFRSTFRDWAAEQTNFPHEVAEMALAHAVGDKVEAAYRRGDLFEKRRRLANAWAGFCATIGGGAGGNVAVLRGKAS